MLKIWLEDSAKSFEKQVKLLTGLVDLALAPEGISLSCEQAMNGLTVERDGNSARITYEKKCEFFRGILTLMTNPEEEFILHERASFRFNGEMLDNSRNSVLNLKTAKEIIIYSALLGLDNILLYNEETFEVPEDPYFGYMRMGYSKADVRKLTEFGKEFGVTIIPCIQTLAHLNGTLRWKCHRDICDYGDTLLVEEEKTYQLIENTIRSWRDCVDTDWVNIGMDEAYFLGRGQYFDKHGHKDHFELMCNHLKRVLEICRKYNFKAMMWSDMFFRLLFGYDYYADQELDPELLKLVPADVMLVYWDYYSTDRQKYDQMFAKHLKFNNSIGFAGGAWKWSGIVPALRHSHEVSKLALSSAKAHGVETVFTTAWGDNGAEASIFTILPTLCLYAELSYADDDVDEKVSAKLEALTGYTLEEFFALDEPNVTPTGNKAPHINPSKYLFFQDVLMGLFDYHVRPDYPGFYGDCAEKLGDLAKRASRFSYLFDTLARLCHVLESKCDLGVRLKAAYELDDRKELERIANAELPDLLVRIENYYRAFRNQWYRESRPGGFDVQDLRFGGLKQRLHTAQDTIKSYLAGNISQVLELEQPRLPYDCRESDEGRDLNVDCNFWNYISTPNVNSHF